MTVTLQTILDEARIEMNDSTPALNQVAVNVGPLVHFTYDLGIMQPGTRFSTGLQTFYVWDTTPTTRTATVRVVQGPGTVIPPDALVVVSPRYTGYEMMVAANSTLSAVSAPAGGLFQMKGVEVSYSATRVGYDLSALGSSMNVYEVLAQQPGPYKNWVRLPTWAYRLERTADTTDFASGTSLTLFTTAANNYPLRINYRAPFGTFTALTDTASGIGLPDSCADVVSLGIAIRLLSGAEVARNDIAVQGNTRRQQEVPAGAQQNSVNGLRLLYQQRLAEEAGRLATAYPAFKAG